MPLEKLDRDPRTFAITGASGNVGGDLARRLTAHGVAVRALVRDPLGGHAPAGAELVTGGFEDRDAVARLVDGVDGLFVVSLPGGAERNGKHESVLRAAAEAGVEHVVYLSFVNPGPDAAFPQGRWHAETEAMLRTMLPGRATAVRPSLYTQALVGAAGVRDGNRLIAPAGGGRVAPVDRRDIAPLLARILLDASHRGETVDLTGPDLVSWKEIAGALPGAPRHEDVAPEAFAALLRDAGRPEPLIEGMLGVFADVRAGRMEPQTNAARAIGGVEPHTLLDTFGDGPRALVRRFADAVSMRDPGAFSDSIAPGYIQHSPSVPAGLEGLQAAFAGFLAAVPDLTVSVVALAAEGDQVAARFAWVGGGRRWTTADWWRVENGLLAEHWDEVDPAVFAGL